MSKSTVATSLTAAVVVAITLSAAAFVIEATAVNAVAATDSPWYAHAARAEAALDEGQITAAMQHWQEAYAAAIGSRRSDGLVELGHLYRRLPVRDRLGESAIARAGQCYLIALLRARGERSIDAILRSTEAFLELKDETMVAQGLKVAREVAAGDPDPRALNRIAMLATRAERSGAAHR
jgi:hypothetical protein